MAARLYRGQATNFRTAGGGFAPVYVVGSETVTFLVCRAVERRLSTGSAGAILPRGARNNSNLRGFLVMKTRVLLAAAAACLSAASFPSAAVSPNGYFVENLSRGLIALRSTDTSVYVGWRLLGSDPSDLAFNLYRSAGGGRSAATQRARRWLRPRTSSIRRRISRRPIPTRCGRCGREPSWPRSAPFVLPANAPVQPYLTVPLQRPPGGNVEVPTGQSHAGLHVQRQRRQRRRSRRRRRIRNRAQVGSVERARQRVGGSLRTADPRRLRARRHACSGASTSGATSARVAHYTQFMVYDLDGDGKAEVACKTADGTVDGAGAVIGDATQGLPLAARPDRRHPGAGHQRCALRQGAGRARVLHGIRGQHGQGARDD